jgi:hypothetical protein
VILVVRPPGVDVHRAVHLHRRAKGKRELTVGVRHRDAGEILVARRHRRLMVNQGTMVQVCHQELRGILVARHRGGGGIRSMTSKARADSVQKLTHGRRDRW